MKITTEIVQVSPSMASEWLEHNTINRPLRRAVVDGYKEAYERGEYQLTHQGIAFADTGELLDGQHRLHAICSMAATTRIPLMVTRGLPQSSFLAIDIGVKRSNSDVLKLPQGLTGLARFFAVLHTSRHSGHTPQSLQPYVSGIQDVYDDLVGFAPTVCKTWSSSQVRGAAVLQILSGSDRDYVLMTYHALNYMEFDAMPPVAAVLYRQHQRGTAVQASGKMDMFCRAFRAFDSRNASNKNLMGRDESRTLSLARDLIQTKVLGMKKAATSAAKR